MEVNFICSLSKYVVASKTIHLLLDSNQGATGVDRAACLHRNSCYKRIRWCSSDDADPVVRIAATRDRNLNIAKANFCEYNSTKFTIRMESYLLDLFQMYLKCKAKVSQHSTPSLLPSFPLDKHFTSGLRGDARNLIAFQEI